MVEDSKNSRGMSMVSTQGLETKPNLGLSINRVEKKKKSLVYKSSYNKYR